MYFDQGRNTTRLDAVIRSRINHRNSSINLSSRLNRETKLNQHISDVFEQLQPYQSTLQQLFLIPNIHSVSTQLGMLKIHIID